MRFMLQHLHSEVLLKEEPVADWISATLAGLSDQIWWSLLMVILDNVLFVLPKIFIFYYNLIKIVFFFFF